ncbi:MAG TPA: DUF2530 domain-containing protein [Jatrophihabitantaceae bacterium]
MTDEGSPAAPPPPGGTAHGGRPVQPPPMQINTGRIVVVGTAIWFVAFVVLLPFYSSLGHHHHRVWLWTCLAGWILGGIGYLVIGRHRSAGRTI